MFFIFFHFSVFPFFFRFFFPGTPQSPGTPKALLPKNIANLDFKARFWAALKYDGTRLCVLQVGFHVFLRTGEMLQMRATHFVGDLSPVWSSVRQNRANVFKTFLCQWFCQTQLSLTICQSSFHSCGQESFCSRTVTVSHRVRPLGALRPVAKRSHCTLYVIRYPPPHGRPWPLACARADLLHISEAVPTLASINATDAQHVSIVRRDVHTLQPPNSSHCGTDPEESSSKLSPCVVFN